jgi:hypothetical protein
MPNTPENPVRINYSHASVPDHVADLHRQAENPQTPRLGNGEKAEPMQTVVFKRRHITLFNKALRDPNHRLRQAAELAMHGFTMAVERDEITTLNQAAKEYGIPHKNLSEWVAKGLIPYESRDKNSIYVRKGMIDKVSRVYSGARERGKPAAPILREMHDELFPASSPHPRTIVDKVGGS